jgi:hypothetical protein
MDNYMYTLTKTFSQKYYEILSKGKEWTVGSVNYFILQPLSLAVINCRIRLYFTQHWRTKKRKIYPRPEIPPPALLSRQKSIFYAPALPIILTLAATISDAWKNFKHKSKYSIFGLKRGRKQQEAGRNFGMRIRIICMLYRILTEQSNVEKIRMGHAA